MSKAAVTIYRAEKYVKEHTLAIQEPPSSINVRLLHQQ